MEDFVSTIEAFISDTMEVVDQVIQDVVIDLGVAVVTLTPVKTGRLKGNWQLTLNVQAGSSLVTYDPTGDETITRIITTAKSLEAGDIAYIANNLTYARDIEFGSSKQAPAGILAISTSEQKFKELVDNAISRRKR